MRDGEGEAKNDETSTERAGFHFIALDCDALEKCPSLCDMGKHVST